MLNFKLNSTQTSCSITGVNDRAVAEIIVLGYVISIELSTFYNCSALTIVTITNSISQMGKRAFLGCSRLRSVIFENFEEWYGDNLYIPSEDFLTLPLRQAM
ncbi:MAG: leucine-rich repeat domain-containing protein [Clostridia bacterium]|nr:leucine-rich repeat domain-containing protein [Clostridia bacterium]